MNSIWIAIGTICLEFLNIMYKVYVIYVPFIYIQCCSNGQYIAAGSDDGSFFIWERSTCNIVRVLRGDESIVNCIQPHPTNCLLATSGIESCIRLWSPRPQVGDFFCSFLQEMSRIDSNSIWTGIFLLSVKNIVHYMNNKLGAVHQYARIWVELLGREL